jgi:spore germination cell wall hydrolase CwlJ-like protein
MQQDPAILVVPGAPRLGRRVAIALLAVLIIAATGAAGWYWYPRTSAPTATAPQMTPAQISQQLAQGEVPPLLFEPLTTDQAMAANAAIPISTLPNPPALPFILPRTDPVAYGAALDCMAVAIYFEAGFESKQGRAAVAQVILNRVRHPLFPKSVCGVVFQGSERITGCQFSFTCDGALLRVPNPAIMAEARVIAETALAGYVEPTVGWATHYHTQWVVPYWGSSLVKTALIGAHIFYRLHPPAGTGRAFTGSYEGVEPVIALMAGLTTPVIVDVPVRDFALTNETAAVLSRPAALPVEVDPAASATATAPRVSTSLPPSPEPVATPTAQPTPAPDKYFPPPPRKPRRLPM